MFTSIKDDKHGIKHMQANHRKHVDQILPGQVAMSWIVVDGGEQHAMRCKELTLELIPILLHTRLPKCLQVINQWPQVDILLYPVTMRNQ